MFQFPAFPTLTRHQDMTPGRFPDLGNPRIIVCLATSRGLSQPSHVLHRLWTPSHPPCTLRSLTTLVLLTRGATFSTGFTLFSKISSTRARSQLGHRPPTASVLGASVFPGWPSDLPRLPRDEKARQDGGGDRIRTDDRLVANQVLYQLSYAPLGASRYGGGPERI